MDARNIADLDKTIRGSSRAFVLFKDGKESAVEFLTDGNHEQAPPEPAVAWGVWWTVPHMLDGAALSFKDRTPPASSLKLEVFNGLQWVPWTTGLRTRPNPQKRVVELEFEPVATRGLRLNLVKGTYLATEIEVYPRVVKDLRSCPERLADSRDLEEELLSSPREPSFDMLSLLALPPPMWATVGLKDSTEIGVFWDGTLAVHYLSSRISFEIGRPPRPLADYRETLTRQLADGWRPAVILRGQAEEVEFVQTTFAGLIGKNRREVLFVRFELTNPSEYRQSIVLRTMVSLKGSKKLSVKNSALYAENSLVVATPEKARPGEDHASLEFDIELPPNGSRDLEFRIPLCPDFDEKLDELLTMEFDSACKKFEEYWDRLLAPAMQLELPEPRLNDFYKAALCLIFINGDGDVMPYGSYPSWYDGKIYGVEEAYCMLALAFCGFHADAQRYLDATYLTEELLKKVEEYSDKAYRHQQYRNGLIPYAVAQAYFVTRDRNWIKKHLPTLLECADWTIANRKKTMVLENGKRPLHYGLLPKWAFGGDIHKKVCYPIYANIACLRGLIDTARILDDLGDSKRADYYRTQAREYRQTIQRAIDASYHPERKPPLLTLSLYSDEPEARDFYQLFASLVLDTDLLDTKRSQYLSRFLEEDNRLFCGMCRFRGGPGGLDAIYSLGYLKHLLRRGEIKRFLLGFYAFTALNLETNCFTSRETSVLYTADNMRDIKGTDPLPCSSAVPLNLLRHMLVLEEIDESGVPSGDLLLFGGAPRRWFEDSKTISVRNASTCFGPLSAHVNSRLDKGWIEVEIEPPTRNRCNKLKIRVPHPKHRSMKRVTVNGRNCDTFDPRREIVELDHPRRPLQIRVYF